MFVGVELGPWSARWQRSFQDDDKIRRIEGKNVIALSAFMLSSLPTVLSRKALVKEMWESGAEMMVGSKTVNGLMFHLLTCLVRS